MKISIITAVYNSVSTISDTIISVDKQTHKNLEHIIVDGRSTDGSLDEINRNTHSRMMLVSEPDNGVYSALNKGINLATGDVIGFAHSDDFLAHDRVIEHISKAFEDPAVEAVFGNLDYISKDNRLKIIRHWSGTPFSKCKLYHGWMPAHPTLYVRSHVYERLGSFNTNFQIAADYDFILRYFSQTTAKIVFIPEVLYKMRLGGCSNQNLKNILKKTIEDYYAIRINGIGGLNTLIRKNLSKVFQFTPIVKSWGSLCKSLWNKILYKKNLQLKLDDQIISPPPPPTNLIN
jgi:glycosyltransferase involved in cell wall biosynthesis